MAWDTWFDAVDVAAMPAGNHLAYIDGKWPTLNAVLATFPGQPVMTITTSGLVRATICDVEFGNATPAVCAQGIRGGLYRIGYSSVAKKDAMFDAMGDLPWLWFAADWTGEEHMVDDAFATQWAAPGYGSPGNYDISAWTVLSFPPPAVIVPPPPPEADDMLICYTPDGKGYYTCSPDGAVDGWGTAQYMGGPNTSLVNGKWTGPPALEAGDTVTSMSLCIRSSVVPQIGPAGAIQPSLIQTVTGYSLITAGTGPTGDPRVFSYGQAPYLGAPSGT